MYKSVKKLSLHHFLHQIGNQTNPQTGTETKTDRILHPVWGICFTSSGGSRNRANASVRMKKFRENGEEDQS